jgi:acetoacetyl-CoA synthetase
VSVALWVPSESRIGDSRLTEFIALVNDRYGAGITGFHDLHRWSVQSPELFWKMVWDYTAIISSNQGRDTLTHADRFPGAAWFPAARLNFAENLLRYRDDRVAIISVLENGRRKELSFRQLYENVARLASALRREGVLTGDRVAGFMPNIQETLVAMLATTSIGAIWSSCSPDFGIDGVLDRFGQIQPKVLFSADGYFYNGRTCDSLQRLAEIVSQIDSLQRVIVVPVVDEIPAINGIERAVLFEEFQDKTTSDGTEILFEQLPFNHPLYIMYSSGTTGVPKCIVHGAGGTLIQHMKEHQLHVGIRPEDILFYYTTCGWMMWNWLVSGLASGATVVLYDGSPFAADGNILLDMIDDEKISIFGTSAKYIAALEKEGKKPRDTHRLDSLKTILSTGSPLAHQSYDYVYRDFKADVCLSSISGGTDIISCFVAGSEVLPVFRGEIQVPGLGMVVEIWDDSGTSVVAQKGELVCCKPFPSAPVGFWNDGDGSKYAKAYFERWPGIWAHGDYGEVTARGGFIIHGRSDAVLNPGGVRIGTAEIYRQVECLEEIIESIVIGQQWQDDVRVVLFVILSDGVQLDDDLRQRIRRSIRENTTPRHVPAKIIAVADIPRTISGKITELAVRDVVHGRVVSNRDALANPEALDLFRDLVELES